MNVTSSPAPQPEPPRQFVITLNEEEATRLLHGLRCYEGVTSFPRVGGLAEGYLSGSLYRAGVRE